MGKQESEGSKRQTIHYLFFWTAGMAFLLVWNCILSLTYYLQARIDPNIDKYYGFGYISGGFLAFFCVDTIKRLISFKTLLMSVPCFLIGLFIGAILLAEMVNGGDPSSLKLVVFLGLCVCMGFINAVANTALVRYYFRFSYVEVSFANSGNAFAGVLSNFVALMLTYMIDEKQLTETGIIYLAFGIVMLVVSLVIFWKYFESGEALDDAHYSTPPMKKADNIPFKETFKLMNSFFFQMLLNYTICLSIFPAFNFSMGLGYTHPSSYQYILLSYNLMDCIGKSLYAKLPMKDNALPHIIGLVRVGYVGFVLYLFAGDGHPEFINKAWITLTFVTTLALSNGYMTSAYFSLSSERVSSKHQSNSGFLMTVGLLLGLTYGSTTMLVGKKST